MPETTPVIQPLPPELAALQEQAARAIQEAKEAEARAEAQRQLDEQAQLTESVEHAIREYGAAVLLDFLESPPIPGEGLLDITVRVRLPEHWPISLQLSRTTPPSPYAWTPRPWDGRSFDPLAGPADPPYWAVERPGARQFVATLATALYYAQLSEEELAASEADTIPF